MPRLPRPHPGGGLHRPAAFFGLRHSHHPWVVLLVVVAVVLVVVLAVRSRR